MSGGSAVAPAVPTRSTSPDKFNDVRLDPNRYDRLYKEWTAAHHPTMRATTRSVLRVVLLYQNGPLTRACAASERSIAARASLSERRVKTILRAASHDGLVMYGGGIVKVILPHDDAGIELKKLRGRDKQLRQMLALGAFSEELEVSRFYWIRSVCDSSSFARPRGRSRSNMAVVKGVALAVVLLMDSNGQPFSWTTLEEISGWSGYKDLAAVRWAIKQLEDGGWLEVTRQTMRGEGLLLRLRHPLEMEEQDSDEADASYGFGAL